MRTGRDNAEKGLRDLLNAWDPIGVADEVPDEYDCMILPLLQRLRNGAGRTEIAGYLHHELVDHFGMDPSGSRPETMATRVVAWWTATNRTTDTGARAGTGEGQPPS
ncbi:hypothetical protein [Streptomyces sp. V2I9]|uniref:hypothetical protein n=1 Tax=Streptomyces sp. V2I9 TaxID=3042304 RepID=UPI0027827B57|nr:hypothetical protein [Streptomyces sp. V2I9]MDQ0986758.1 hypothetical protein [Streptomyces sp. V2I9]